jgi:hypothetical protein
MIKNIEALTKKFLFTWLAGVLLSLTVCAIAAKADVIAHREAADGKTVPAAIDISDIKFSFKLDPQLTRSMYMGDRWVSPPAYTIVREGKKLTVDARAQGLDSKGMPVDIKLKWIPADPDMVTVAPGEGKAVKITVKRAGQSMLEVASQGLSKLLTIKAAYQGDAIKVEISQ